MLKDSGKHNTRVLEISIIIINVVFKEEHLMKPT